MRTRVFLLAGLAALAAPLPALAQNNQKEAVATISTAEEARADAILRDFAADYRNDPMAIGMTFGIKLGDAWWTVAVERKETGTPRGRLVDHAFGPHTVNLTRGAPATPTWYFQIADLGVLELIASGKVNAGTAAIQSFGSDKVGVEMRDQEGFASTAGDAADRYLALSHFFTKGKPEVTRFGRDNSLATHGAQATSLYNSKDFRIGFFSIGPQQTANAQAELEFGQVPNLLIITSGKGTLHSDNGPMPLEKGMSVFVAQFVKHSFVNDGNEPLEGILVLLGDNSEFAYGTSYPGYIEDLNDFYRTYPFAKPKPKPAN